MNAVNSMGAKILRLWCLLGSCGGMTATDRRNYRQFYYWVLAWFVAYVVATILIGEKIVSDKTMAVAIIIIPVVIALLVFRAYTRFFSSVDELTQRIQLEGIKVGFALGIFVIPAFQLMELADISQFRSTGPWVVMLVGYWVGLVLTARRYR